MRIELRPVQPDDLPVIYEYQLDPDANRMAVANPRDRATFDEHWQDALNDPAVTARVVIVDGELVGNIGCFKLRGLDSVGYWIKKEWWGRGVATRALSLFLNEVQTRPLYARASSSNIASVRVLEKCGFKLQGYEWAEATERFPASEEAKFRLL